MRMITGLKAQCRLGTGSVREIRVLDISEAGCMISKKMMRLQVQERILIKLPGLSYQGANVLWTEDDRAGLAFEQPLYSAVVSHMQERAA